MIYAGKTLEISREFRNKTFQSAKWVALENFSLTEANVRTGRDAGDPWDSTEQRNAGILPEYLQSQSTISEINLPIQQKRVH